MRTLATLLVVLLLLIPAVSCKKQAAGKLPEVSLKDLSGNTVNLADFAGKPLLINFWATWCGPCRFEIPTLNELQRKYKDSGLVIVGIATDENGLEAVRPFMKEVPMQYRVYLQTDGVEEKFGGIWALPTSFFFDKAGNQIGKTVGMADRDAFEEKIAQMLK